MAPYLVFYSASMEIAEINESVEKLRKESSVKKGWPVYFFYFLPTLIRKMASGEND